ncbi:hypothetical protein [Cerasicoccus arenae]|uniref:Methyltransferase domain-containing protein n=1 Tax=Cerasicoccus arenae TaxID=424488 RepID=A0A8J3DAD4_9BACT|nr:hypothetical protein [Cerasicoccus arenae]MBK1859489.1 hypothetical protein [Cerasicoccus arenae]GHB94935.1 hypothetical protein GCM10007047_08110 [Cerasicoccus arenae]
MESSKIMQRNVQPEILDSLAHDDPQALANRRDLRLINALLRNPDWFARCVFPALSPKDRVMELGAGEGVIGMRLAREMGPDAVDYVAIDLAPPPSSWPDRFSWRRVDCLSLPDFNNLDALWGNMILHQFQDDQLRALGEKIERSRLRLLSFVEPARYRLHLWQLCALGPLICAVSRHDGAVSVRAGFRDHELPALLGLGPDWRISIRHTFLGGYRMLAERPQA